MNENPAAPEEGSVRPSEDVVAGVGRTQTELLEVAGLVDVVPKENLPPMKAPCSDDYAGDLYSASHSWRVDQIPEGQMRVAMDRLHEGLPGRGWRVVMYEPNNSQNRRLELRVEHEEGELFARAAFLDSTQPHVPDTYESEIRFTVFTPCY
ncbi:hypothetical protein [Streptomyces otsuchiensis]|uniref:hypothetical protein n=1 Tax=Streptomyces otsuchiensis TaxID=2681388 RepID=UPI0010317AA0|nr:hypothetical protein [Streptomyces otsuchiensis]